MKFTWGTAIAIILGLFAISMGYAVFKAVQQDYDLVTDDYYAEELAYQDKIDQKQNALALKSQAKLTWTEKGLVIEFPQELQNQEVTATVAMYCVTEKDNDFSIKEEHWKLTDLAIPAERFSSGKWIAKATIIGAEKDYYFDPEIVIP